MCLLKIKANLEIVTFGNTVLSHRVSLPVAVHNNHPAPGHYSTLCAHTTASLFLLDMRGSAVTDNLPALVRTQMESASYRHVNWNFYSWNSSISRLSRIQIT